MLSSSSFNLVDVTGALLRQWKRIAAFVVVCLVLATGIVFIMPQQYRSSAVVLPANPVLADKARLFNSQIQGLYSFFGNGDDVETLYTIAQLDTVYYQLTDSFHLQAYYHTNPDKPAAVQRRNAMRCLRGDLTVQKTDNGQLKITAWTKDAELSASLANRLVSAVQSMWKTVYAQTSAQLNSSLAALQQHIKQYDTSRPADLQGAARVSDIAQAVQYQRSVNELQLAIASTPPSLYVIEIAAPAPLPGRPDKMVVLISTFLVSLVFAMILSLVYERRD
jgi:capsular polysaccharide biosynthesis protein